MNTQTVHELIDRLFELYNEVDDDRRHDLAGQILDAEAEFLGNDLVATGRDQVADGFRSSGERLVRTSRVDRQGSGWVRATWQVVDADGSVVQTEHGRPYAGLAVFEVTGEGLLRRIVPFVGDAPPPT